MNFLKILKKDQFKVLVVDDYKELPDFKKIAVPDLKQYLIDAYSEVQNLKGQNLELEEKYKKSVEYKQLYEAALITSDEFKKRDESNKTKINELRENLEQLTQRNLELLETINEYKINEMELNKKEKEIKEIIKKENNEELDKYKENLITKIENTKGNISKSKLFNIIREIK